MSRYCRSKLPLTYCIIAAYFIHRVTPPAGVDKLDVCSESSCDTRAMTGAGVDSVGHWCNRDQTGAVCSKQSGQLFGQHLRT